MSQHLTVPELKKALAGLPADKFAVGLFMHHVAVSQHEWLNPLARYLQAEGYAVFGILTERAAQECDLDAAPYVCVLDPGEVKELDRINVFVLSDQDNGTIFPQASRVLGVCHGLSYGVATSFSSLTSISNLDGYLFSGPITPATRVKASALWTGMASRAAASRKNPHFHIIPLGYPRLAALVENIAELQVEPDSIAYAPIVTDYCHEMGGNRIKTYGARIIRILLRAFPHENIIFRPYILDLGCEAVEAIRAEFAAEPRFILDANPGREFCFSRSKLLITDFSHIAPSFAFTTLRPAFRFKPWEGKCAPIANDFGGFDLTSFTDLTLRVRQALANLEPLKEVIRQSRQRLVMPFENSLQELARLLPDFYSDRPHADWLTIERCQEHLTPTPAEIVCRVLAEDTPSRAYIATVALLGCHRQNYLLAAFSLHQGRLYRPQLRLYNPYIIDPKVIPAWKAVRIPYEDVDANIPRALYKLALLEAIKNRDASLRQLIEALLADYNANFPEQEARQ